MKTDGEVRIMIRERAKGKTQEQAAARAGMSVRTARTYERLGKLPSQLKQPRTYRTRPDPFAEDWPWIEAELTRDPALARDDALRAWRANAAPATIARRRSALSNGRSPPGAPAPAPTAKSSSRRCTSPASLPNPISPT